MPPMSLRARSGFLALGLLVAACAGTTPTAAPTAAPATAEATKAPEPTAAASPSAAPTEAPTEAPTATPVASPSEAPSASAAPTVQASAVNGSIYFMGYDIELTEASYDPAVGVRIKGTFKNTSLTDTNLLYIPDDGKVTVAWNGQVTALGMDNEFDTRVPVGGTVTSAFKGSPPDGFVLADAVLTLGHADQHQSTLPLAAGSTATSEFPRPFPVTGSVKVGNMARVTFTGGQVANVTCSGNTDQVAFGPAKLTDQSILLNVTSSNPNHQWDTITHSYVKAPDGTSTNGTPGGRYMGAGTTFRGNMLCYTVGAPAAGHFVTHWSAERTNKKATFAFDVPAAP